jgi:hypothetical protein
MPLYIKQNNHLIKVSDGIALTDLEDKTVALDMSNGDQVVNATTGKVMSSVTIEKPVTMVASNIKDGVDIGGVVGTMVADPNENLIKHCNANNDPYDVVLPASLTTIRGGSFYYDTNIRNITFKQTSITGGGYLGSSFCYYSSVKNVVYENKLPVLQGMWNGCEIETFTGEIDYIQNSGFTNNYYLKRINSNVDGEIILTGCRSIGSRAFENGIATTLITKVVALDLAYVNNSYQGDISPYAFNNQTGLQSIEVDYCRRFDSRCFSNCTGLQDIIIRRTDNVVILYNVNCFENVTGPVTIHVPSSLISSYQTASNWSTLYNNGVVTFVALT